jgi:hypothetical protein
MPPAGYPAFLQYLQSGRVRKIRRKGKTRRSGSTHVRPLASSGGCFAKDLLCQDCAESTTLFVKRTTKRLLKRTLRRGSFELGR